MDKTHWGLAAMMVATAVGAGWFFGLWRPQAPEATAQNETRVAVSATLAGLADEPPREWVVVHVAGRVVRPGLVRVPRPARVGDVLRAAGGAMPDARLGEINLAAAVSDGDRVVVPGPTPSGGQEDYWTDTAGDSPLIDLNRATASQLEGIPGVGPVLAARIVDHRTAHGPFREVEDLLDVSGIGEKKLSGLREYVVLP